MNMEVICLHCGASNRSTSRFCARCGRALAQQGQTGQKNEGSIELPWLQAVQDKAVQKTSALGPEAAGQSAPNVEPAPASEPVEQTPIQKTSADSQLSTAQPSEQQADVSKQKDEPPPPWVVSILEPSVTPTGPEQSYEAEELSHIMPWAHGKPEEPAEATASVADADSNPGLPPWLGGVTVQETLQSLNPADQKITEPVEVDLEGIEPFVPPIEPGDDGQAAPEELPAWLRTMGGQPETAKQPEFERSVLIPSLAKEPTDYLVSPPSRDVPVRPPRAGAVETLAALMQPVAPEASRRVIAGNEFMPSGRVEVAPQKAGWRGKLLPDGLIYLIVLAALLTVLIVRPPFGDVATPTAPGVLDFYNQVESVPAGKPVLVVYDWDASRSAEMSVLAQAVMHHIMKRKLPFVTESTVPQGPGFAQQITDQMAADTQAKYGYTYGKEYLVLGYLPGNEAALKSLVTNFVGALPLDFVNSRRLDSYTLVQGGSVSKIEDFALIVDLASSEAELRNWIEQVASRTDVPIVAAVPQGLEPFARPYLGVPGAKLTAVVSGTAGASQYIRQLEMAGKGTGLLDKSVDLNTRLNAQSVAALLVALVIAAAFVMLGTKRILRRQ